MSDVLTEESTVECGHSGKVAIAGSNLLQVNGKTVLTKQGVNGKAVSNCQTKPKADPSGTPIDKPCTTVSSVDNTEASKLRVGGAAVLIEPLKGATDGLKDKKPTADLTAEAVQTRLKAD
jgi:hypothetical protein